MNIYELTSILDDPRFDEFDFDEQPSLLKNDYLYQDFDGERWQDRAKLGWEPYPLADLWTPKRVSGNVGQYVDYTTASGIPVFSQRAVKVLEDFLKPNGELLEIVSKQGKFFVYNILSKSEALDLAGSQVEFIPNSAKETAVGIDYFAFHESNLVGASIFRIREYPVAVFVTERFVERVEQAGLNGFYFIRIAPFPQGESWEQVERERIRARKGRRNALRGNSVIIRLPVTGQCASGEEEERGFVVANTVADFLTKKQTSLDTRFIGAIEQLETTEGALLIVLACNDANTLTQELSQVFPSIKWPKPVSLEKVYGDRYDERTKREIVTVPKATDFSQ